MGRLEGGGNSGRRHQLTSKDILQSLSEAKDDHMQQRGAEVGQNGPQSSSSWSGGGGRESPFSIRNEFADVDLSGGVSVVERGRDERVGMEGGGEERPVSGSSIWTCCFRCRGTFLPHFVEQAKSSRLVLLSITQGEVEEGGTVELGEEAMRWRKIVLDWWTVMN